MFSDILKALRNKKGVSQTQLATILNVSAGNVGDWETGKSKPGYNALIALSRFFEISADELLELTPLDNASESRGHILTCDGVPLSESEADLIAMYRLIDERDSQTVFDLTRMKYEQATGEKGSSYSTYTDTGPHKNRGPEIGFRDTSETA